MTVLSEYDRLEAIGLWRENPEDQRREVVVSLGDATLIFSDKSDRAITHWSLPAVRRLNAGHTPAIFAPSRDATETLEIEDDAMIAAIEKVRSVLARGRARPGRLRLAVTLTVVLAMAALAYWRLPETLMNYTLRVVPPAKRAEIGAKILDRVGQIGGKPCTTALGSRALDQLHARLLPGKSGRLVILPEGIVATAHLPGGTLLLSRRLIEDYDEPDVIAGYVLAEDLRREHQDPLADVLLHAGFLATFRLYTTGELPEDALQGFAEDLLIAPTPELSASALLERFAKAGVRSTPYAYAVDSSGETTLNLIEADPYAQNTGARAVLPDSAWVSLQGICAD